MNDDQVEACFAKLKSSSREPDMIDNELENRMIQLHSKMGRNRIRSRRVAVVMALLLLSGSSFVAFGGDTVVANYIAPSSEKEADGNPIPHDFSIGKWLHQAHDHLWKHFHAMHGTHDSE